MTQLHQTKTLQTVYSKLASHLTITMQYSKVYYSYDVPCLFTEVWIVTANTANDNKNFQFHHIHSKFGTAQI